MSAAICVHRAIFSRHSSSPPPLLLSREGAAAAVGTGCNREVIARQEAKLAAGGSAEARAEAGGGQDGSAMQQIDEIQQQARLLRRTHRGTAMQPSQRNTTPRRTRAHSVQPRTLLRSRVRGHRRASYDEKQRENRKARPRASSVAAARPPAVASPRTRSPLHPLRVLSSEPPAVPPQRPPPTGTRRDAALASARRAARAARHRMHTHTRILLQLAWSRGCNRR